MVWVVPISCSCLLAFWVLLQAFILTLVSFFLVLPCRKFLPCPWPLGVSRVATPSKKFSLFGRSHGRVRLFFLLFWSLRLKNLFRLPLSQSFWAGLFGWFVLERSPFEDRILRSLSVCLPLLGRILCSLRLSSCFFVLFSFSWIMACFLLDSLLCQSYISGSFFPSSHWKLFRLFFQLFLTDYSIPSGLR